MSLTGSQAFCVYLAQSLIVLIEWKANGGPESQLLSPAVHTDQESIGALKEYGHNPAFGEVKVGAGWGRGRSCWRQGPGPADL